MAPELIPRSAQKSLKPLWVPCFFEPLAPRLGLSFDPFGPILGPQKGPKSVSKSGSKTGPKLGPKTFNLQRSEGSWNCCSESNCLESLKTPKSNGIWTGNFPTRGRSNNWVESLNWKLSNFSNFPLRGAQPELLVESLLKILYFEDLFPFHSRGGEGLGS